MIRTLSGLTLVVGLLLSPPGWAAPPQIGGTSPYGAQKGAATEITISGSNLSGNPELIAPFAFEAAPWSTPSDASNWKFKLTVRPDAALGVYPIRVKTDGGLSNPFLFSVGQLPQVAEKEENSVFEAAQPIPPLAVVEGQAAGNDVDFFRFPGKKGQKVVVDAQCSRIGSGVDPTIRLTTASHVFVASADDSPGLLTDARLSAVLPEDTDYVIELSDSRYQGGARPIYRLVVGAVPMADECFPIGGRQGETTGFELRGGTVGDSALAVSKIVAALGSELVQIRANTCATTPGGTVMDVESLGPVVVGDAPEIRESSEANALPDRAPVPVALNGRIDPAGDEDRFVLSVTPGQALRIEVDASEYGSALDGVLQVIGANGSVLSTADDTTAPRARRGNQAQAPPLVSPDPSLNYTVPSGVTEITLAIRDLGSRGGIGYPYRIRVKPNIPSFDLALNDSQVSVPKGGAAAIGVTVTRKGYNGPITLNVLDPPPGMSVRSGKINQGQLLGALSVSAAPDAAFGVVQLKVVGEAEGPGSPLVVSATKEIVFAQQGPLPTNAQTQVGLATAATAPLPITLDAPASVEVVHGYGVPIPIKAVRTNEANGALALTPLPLPPGVTIAAAQLAEKKSEATVTVNAAVEAPLGLTTVALLAKGTVGKVGETLSVPAITLDVVRPAALELAVKNIEVKQGASVALAGKIVRKGPFKEPVTVKISGLPAGLKAEPVSVAPDKTEFTVTVAADAKAAAATANANVALAFQVNKKDYSMPTTPLPVKVVAAK